MEAVAGGCGCVDAADANENAGGAAFGVELPSFAGSAGLPKREGVVEAGVLRIGDSYRGRRNDNINTYAVVEAAGAPKAGFALIFSSQFPLILTKNDELTLERHLRTDSY